MDDDTSQRDFHHPFQPYDIQRQFMNAVYDCLEEGKVGIFESPTGTGKSLSLICGSLTWLRHHKRRLYDQGLASVDADGDEPAWIVEHARQQKKEEALRRRRELESRIAKIKASEQRMKARYTSGQAHSKRQKVSDARADHVDETRFILVDYDSDDGDDSATRASTFDASGLSAETKAMMQQFGYAANTKDESEEEQLDELKIFFCSRTHSQLSQFAHELGRVRMPPSLPLEGDSDNDDALVEDVKYVTLGSRKTLCINPSVSKLGSATAINERCHELQQPGTLPESKCPYVPSKETQVLVNEFRDHALARVRDIEELGTLGRKLGMCPYYASRRAIVSLPYPLLLQKSARDALGLSLKEHVVIIDEAHNLMDAITGTYSVAVTLPQMQEARMQLTVYLQKFRNKLKGKNRVYVAQTMRILDSIISYLQAKSTDPEARDGVVNLSDLMLGKGVDQINLFKLNAYLNKSRLARKVDGYTNFAREQATPDTKKDKNSLQKDIPRQSVPVLMHIQGFLLTLMNPSTEGRFFFAKEDQGDVVLSYLLLDPTYHFKDVIQEARAVVLAGGTMSPMADYEQHLLSYLHASKIMTLSCGHVTPPSNLLAVPVTRSLEGREFDFTYGKRGSDTATDDLGNAIVNFIQHIPDGVVIFFPSYSYLDQCVTAWKQSKAPGLSSVWESFLRFKAVFLEQRSQNSAQGSVGSREVAANSVLSAYSNAIASGSGRGALLFAVIGGTLSEGINFSDALGRGVVVVGLPFPNQHSAEWKARMEYISRKAALAGQDGKNAARDYYENTCMRSVNQCVGRAIRHKADYAAILMLDRRYGTPRIQSKLPGWIRSSLVKTAGVQEVDKRLDDFFTAR
ncbi:DNA repair helicase [Polyplosphaeria fusca]|uniref:ATP-dependent DNA helicase CHL1 n=1 Tax=Polyplosphaeria fusca TaxID=682080 RepID=A0A9P4V676_9PLEO|nr:DNA repair helicase [Polyplosphaeria fusca]